MKANKLSINYSKTEGSHVL